MRMHFPSTAIRSKVAELLERFYDEYQKPDFEEAMRLLSVAYDMPIPEVTFYEYINHGKWGGVTWEDGKIGLQHPEDWKKSKKYSKADWVRTALHEFAHYLYWADAETKADRFAQRFLKGAKK